MVPKKFGILISAIHITIFIWLVIFKTPESDEIFLRDKATQEKINHSHVEIDQPPEKKNNTQHETNHTHVNTTQPDENIEHRTVSQQQPLKERTRSRFGSPDTSSIGLITMTKGENNYLLCRLNIQESCKTHEIAEMIDRMVQFSPIYYQLSRDPLMFALHDYFLGMLKTIGIRAMVTEGVYPGQDYVKTKPGNEPWEYQIPISETFYQRENILNFHIKKTIDLDLYDYILWIDAHQWFHNYYWPMEAIWKVEHFPSIQLFQSITYKTFSNGTRFDANGMMYNYHYRRPIRDFGMMGGNAWMIKKETYKAIDHLLDICIAASCDIMFGTASLKNPDDWTPVNEKPNYYGQLMPWVREANKHLGGGSMVRGHLSHIEHEHIFDYFAKLSAIESSGFQPEKDLTRDENFLLHTASAKIKRIFPPV